MALLQNRSSFDFQFLYLEARKAAALAVKMLKEHNLKEFGCRLDSYNSTASKVF